MVSRAQAGTPGEALLAACRIRSTGGRFQAYRPLNASDHRDFAVHRRGSLGTARVRAKTATRIDGDGRIVARARHPQGAGAEAPRAPAAR